LILGVTVGKTAERDTVTSLDDLTCEMTPHCQVIQAATSECAPCVDALQLVNEHHLFLHPLFSLAPLYITQLLDCINLALLGQNKEDNPRTMPWAFIVTDYNDITVMLLFITTMVRLLSLVTVIPKVNGLLEIT